MAWFYYSVFTDAGRRPLFDLHTREYVTAKTMGLAVKRLRIDSKFLSFRASNHSPYVVPRAMYPMSISKVLVSHLLRMAAWLAIGLLLPY